MSKGNKRITRGITDYRLNFREKKYKVQMQRRSTSYLVGADDSIVVSSASTVLFLGILIGFMTLILQNTIIWRQQLQFANPDAEFDAFEVMFVSYLPILLQFFLGDIFVNISNFLLGWFIGGIVSGTIYKEDGKKGPLYSIILLTSLSIYILLIAGAILFANEVFGSEFSGFSFEILLAIFFTVIVLAIISIPLGLVALVGNRIGIKMSNV